MKAQVYIASQRYLDPFGCIVALPDNAERSDIIGATILNGDIAIFVADKDYGNAKTRMYYVQLSMDMPKIQRWVGRQVTETPFYHAIIGTVIWQDEVHFVTLEPVQ